MDLITVDHVSKRFPLPDGKGEFTVLGDVTLSVHRGEVLALLGRSGSGKSTLLRIMSGLIRPTEGEVRSNGLPMRGANPNLAMVFQSFALLPWLTVQENVELGLAARHVPVPERRERALKAIDIVGLDGFENAYPKELSGGMKQRVGFARAFVLEPEVLFMDEPFSALDVLTAENLRGEIDDLWNAGTFPSKSILIVTHNIEEAVYLADRVVILGSKPGRIRGELQVNLPRPHDRSNPRFKALVDYIYSVMTNPDIEVTGHLEADGGEAVIAAGDAAAPLRSSGSPFAKALPHVRVGGSAVCWSWWPRSVRGRLHTPARPASAAGGRRPAAPARCGRAARLRRGGRWRCAAHRHRSRFRFHHDPAQQGPLPPAGPGPCSGVEQHRAHPAGKGEPLDALRFLPRHLGRLFPARGG